jgi:molybdopterin-synthase adenylyltransferase
VVLDQQGLSSQKMKLTNSYYNRYAKQIILKKIGLHGQKKIANSKILIIGMGGLGCPLLLYLANSGIGNIGIVDNDIVDITNLNRQVLFTTKDIGKNKVELAKKFVKKINNKIKIKIFNTKISKKNIKNIVNQYDIICDGTDNYNSRYLINDYCFKSKKILISAAISKFSGHLFKFDFKSKKTPCFRCFMPEFPLTENNCDSEGVISSLAGIMGTLQSNEVLRSVLNLKTDLAGNMIIFDALKLEFRKVKISRNSKCINKC